MADRIGETESLAALADLGIEEPTWVICEQVVNEDTGERCGNEALSLDQHGRCVRCIERVERARSRVRTLAHAAVPEGMAWVTPDHPDLAVILGLQGHHRALGQRLRALVYLERLKVITLLGNSGEGKTHLAVALMQPMLEGSLFTLASALGVSDRQHRFGRGEAPLLERAIKARVLVIDDLEQPDDQKAFSTIRRVVWERFMHGRRTVITSGLKASELSAIFGEGAERRFGLPGKYNDVLGEAKLWNLTSDRFRRIVTANRDEIARRHAKGESTATLAEAFGVAPGFIEEGIQRQRASVAA